MSSNTPLNNFKHQFNKFKNETEQNFRREKKSREESDDTSHQIVGLLRDLADENKKIIKDLANRTAQVKNLETAVGRLGGFLQNLTGQLLTLEERVSALEEVQGAQLDLQHQPGLQVHGAGRLGFRMKKSKSRKRRPKKKSRASKKRGKKKSRASKKRGKK